jgi:hypothetical protein
VPGDRHRLVERGDLEGQDAWEDRDALARDGVLDEQVLAHAAERATAADDARQRGLQVDDDPVAGLKAATSTPTSASSPAGSCPSGIAAICPSGASGDARPDPTPRSRQPGTSPY